MANSITTGSIQLPASVSTEIWDKAQESSAVMQLAQAIELPGNGLSIPVVTGDPVADWVQEGAAKPVSTGTLSVKQMRAYTLAVIVPFSNQFRNDYDSLYNELVNRIPGVLANKFDRTAFGFDAAPGDNFDTLDKAEGVNVNQTGSKVYDAFVDVDAAIAANGSQLTGFAVSPQGRALVLKAKDSNGRPLFTASNGDSNLNAILGYPAYQSRAAYNAATTDSGNNKPATVGFAGDWTSARYGMVNDLEITISDQATLTVSDGNSGTKTLNLWQQNMFAVRAEFRAGFVVRDIADFRKLTDGASA